MWGIDYKSEKCKRELTRRTALVQSGEDSYWTGLVAVEDEKVSVYRRCLKVKPRIC